MLTPGELSCATNGSPLRCLSRPGRDGSRDCGTSEGKGEASRQSVTNTALGPRAHLVSKGKNHLPIILHADDSLAVLECEQEVTEETEKQFSAMSVSSS